MSLWHRAPREVYRVYGEDEYLDDGGESAEYVGSGEDGVSGEATESAKPAEHATSVGYAGSAEAHRSAQNRAVGRHPVSSTSHRSHSGRLVGVGLLVGVTVGTLGLIALNVSQRPTYPSKPTLGHGLPSHSPRHEAAADSASTVARTADAASSHVEWAGTADSQMGPRAHSGVSRSKRDTLPAGTSLDSASRSLSVQASVLMSSMVEPHVAPVQPWAPRPVASGLGASATAESSGGDEFDFER